MVRWQSVVVAWLAAGLSVPAVALIPSAATAAPDESLSSELEKARDLYDRGKARFDTTDYADAILLWTEAYSILSDTPENAPVKAAIIYNLSTAQERAYEIDKDVTHLRRAVLLMEQYAESLPALYEDGEALDAEAEKIDERIAAVRSRIDAHQEPEGEPTPPPLVDEPTPPPTVDTPPDDKNAKPLIIAGAVLAGVGVAGIALMAGGLAMGGSANDVDALEPDDLAGRRAQFDRGRNGNVMAYVGGAVGGAALVTGAVLLGIGLKRRSDARTAAAPILAPGFAGVSVSARF